MSYIYPETHSALKSVLDSLEDIREVAHLSELIDYQKQIESFEYGELLRMTKGFDIIDGKVVLTYPENPYTWLDANVTCEVLIQELGRFIHSLKWLLLHRKNVLSMKEKATKSELNTLNYLLQDYPTYLDDSNILDLKVKVLLFEYLLVNYL